MRVRSFSVRWFFFYSLRLFLLFRFMRRGRAAQSDLHLRRLE